MPIRALVIFVILAAIIPFASCKEDPQAPVEEDGIDWPAMTDRNDVLETLVLTYMNPKDGESSSKYNDLMHSQYFFGLYPDDVMVGGSPIITRAEDLYATEWIFENESRLELTISPLEPPWYEYPELKGEPCVNCWQAEGVYLIRAQFGDEDMVFFEPLGVLKTMTVPLMSVLDKTGPDPPASYSFSIIVAPDENNADKWVIRAMYDLGPNN